MATQAADEMIADLMFGTTRALKAICEQLIDKGALNRELLLSDLLQAQVDMAGKAGLAGAVPAALRAELGGKSPE